VAQLGVRRRASSGLSKKATPGTLESQALAAKLLAEHSAARRPAGWAATEPPSRKGRTPTMDYWT